MTGTIRYAVVGRTIAPKYFKEKNDAYSYIYSIEDSVCKYDGEVAMYRWSGKLKDWTLVYERLVG